MLFLIKDGNTLKNSGSPDKTKSGGVMVIPRSQTIISLFFVCLCFLFLFFPDRQLAQDKPENLLPINSYQTDYAPQISPNGRYLIFQSDRPGYLESHNLWLTSNLNYENPLAKPKWIKPIPLNFPLELSIVRQQQNFFSSGSPPLSQEETKAKIISSLVKINSNHFVGAPALVYHHQTKKPIQFYFTSYTKESPNTSFYTNLDIYYSHFINEKWTKPSYLSIINGEFDDRMPSLSQDGNYIVFSSNRPGGFGGYDLWASKREKQSQKWSKPLNLGATINTPDNESAPSLSIGGRMLFFSSDRHGGFGHYDLYLSRRQNSKNNKDSNGNRSWLQPQNIGKPFNSVRDDEYFSTSHDGLWAYFTSDRNTDDQKEKDGFDIYRTYLPLELYDPVDVLLTGQILDGSVHKNSLKSREILGVEATIKVFVEDKVQVLTSKAFRGIAPATNIRNFAINLKSGKFYRIQVSAPGFIPQEFSLDYRSNMLPGTVEQRIIILKKIESQAQPGDPIDSQNQVEQQLEPATCLKQTDVGCLREITIYFKTDNHEISSKQTAKIKQVVAIMQSHPHIRVHIGGHTDNTNTQTYNQRLSEKRAKTVKRHLIKIGIAAKRLSTVGYSFLKPAVTGESTKDQHLNRRVEFSLLP